MHTAIVSRGMMRKETHLRKFSVIYYSRAVNKPKAHKESVKQNCLWVDWEDFPMFTSWKDFAIVDWDQLLENEEKVKVNNDSS